MVSLRWCYPCTFRYLSPIFKHLTMTKREEFTSLYSKWKASYLFSAHGPSDPAAKELYEKLKEWAVNNRGETIQYATEILENEPDDIVTLLDDLYGCEYTFEANGFMPLDIYCNLWLNILHKNKGHKDYYKDWRKWQRHLDKHYIPWNPFEEENPNVTLDEFKEGKRNGQKRTNQE